MRATTFNIPPNPVEAHKVMANAVWRTVKAEAIAGNLIAVRVCEQNQTRDAQEKYHAMIGEIASQVGGDLQDPADAKRILISAFHIDTRLEFADDWAKFGDMRMGRGLRGEVVILGVQSRDFTRKLASAFIDWLYAFGAEVGVVFIERYVDPDTGEILLLRNEPALLGRPQ
jgi:hypothetical protein